MKRKCENCEDDAISSTDRFCKACRKLALDELRGSGKLTAVARGRSWRHPGAKEDRKETHDGIDD